MKVRWSRDYTPQHSRGARWGLAATLAIRGFQIAQERQVIWGALGFRVVRSVP